LRREDFSALRETTYLDSACMSLRPEQVIDKINEYYREYPACHGRSAHSLAEKATQEYEDARKEVAELIDASPGDLMFTSGTTEAINTVAYATDFEKVVISDREHNSNLVPWQEQDIELNVISTEDGFDLEKLEEEVDEDTLVSVVHVSNLDGNELPVERISEITKENGGHTLVDAAQSIPHREFSVEEIKADFVAFSGHKMLGPSGTGGLYASERGKKKLGRFKTGGGAVTSSTYSSAEFKDFPDGMEPGLPNLAGFIGLGEAARYMNKIGLEKIHRHEEELTELLREKLSQLDEVEEVGKNGTGVISFQVENMDPHKVALMLDQRDIAVRSGMHCLHSWFDRYDREPTVRASLHLYNNEEDIRQLFEALKKITLLS
jgi:cysteine desulfurase/selenocysteine lyase